MSLQSLVFEVLVGFSLTKVTTTLLSLPLCLLVAMPESSLFHSPLVLLIPRTFGGMLQLLLQQLKQACGKIACHPVCVSAD